MSRIMRNQPQLPLDIDDGRPARGEPAVVAPGAFWVRGWLDLAGQVTLVDACREWFRPPAGLRRPRMPNGGRFSTRAVCLGWHWYPYRYTRTCDDGDGAPVKPFPELLHRLAADACAAAGYEPGGHDAAIVNLYEDGAALGLHQDSAEGDAVAAGSPVVTVSLGDTCVFRFGNGLTRGRPYQDVTLESGDLFVFGGPSRLAYHGVPKVFPGTAPAELGLDGRISVTLRDSGQD
ncbi:MAG TPA: alpha-ketoglutarate-dependent dioxygenase AlkB [Acidimicrobiales bacterium]|nr:alpha-ketoglutarate-dependent dioxygenase AlkB [Acidimicrobiales bacterium]